MSLLETDDIEISIILLAKLLDNNWEKDYTFIDQEIISNTSLDLLYILGTFFHKANSIDLNDFIFTTYLDIKKLEMYKQAINYFYT